MNSSFSFFNSNFAFTSNHSCIHHPVTVLTCSLVETKWINFDWNSPEYLQSFSTYSDASKLLPLSSVLLELPPLWLLKIWRLDFSFVGFISKLSKEMITNKTFYFHMEFETSCTLLPSAAVRHKWNTFNQSIASSQLNLGYWSSHLSSRGGC